jgi:purine-binding chemotaxis protein CheW
MGPVDAMSLSEKLVVFLLDSQRYALRLPTVNRVVRAVEVTPLPGAPGIVLGVINVEGRVVPVFDIRRRFRLPDKELSAGSHLIIARTSGRTVAILADSISSVVEVPSAEITTISEVLPQIEHVAGVAKLGDGMILIHDLDRFLSLEEEQALDEVLPRD